LSVVLLWTTGQRWPARRYLPSLGIVAAGVILGFPLLSAWALRRVPATHGAIVLGLLPLATTAAAAWRASERPSRRFWVTSAIGSCAVVGYAILSSGAGRPQIEDLALLGAVVAAALGYAEGGRLARDLGGWQVISWALVLAAPFIAIPVALVVRRHGLLGPPIAWACFGYVAIISQLLAFFAWYRGLALGGVARVGQVQLLQPFFTIAAAALLLGEHVSLLTGVALLAVVASVAIGRKAAIARV
jgi:drug/metabolite transporter (DMT)-like permease